MRRLALIGVLSACLLGGAPLAAMADEKTEKALEERIKKLEQMVEALSAVSYTHLTLPTRG